MKEIWKQYRDTNYYVSNKGRVKNVKTNKILAQNKKEGKENDYMHIRITINGKKINKQVHRMVAECFLEDYSEELQVNHKNCLRHDNNVSNLEMCTREYNMEYAFNSGNMEARKPIYAIDVKTGERIDFKSIWEGTNYLINVLGKTGTKNGISSYIKKCCIGKTISAYGYYWYFTNDRSYDHLKEYHVGEKRNSLIGERERLILEERGFTENCIRDRIKKYNLTFEEAINIPKHTILAAKDETPREIDKNSKLYKGINKKFGRLTVVEIIKEKGKNAKYRCVCDCGNEIITWYNNLYIGKTLSCGCLKNK